MKTIQYLLLVVFFTAFSAISCIAQLNYPAGGFSTFAGTYSDLGTTGTIIPVANTDDAFSSPKYIGFTFNFNGASYDSFVLNTNGFIKLGRDTASGSLLYTDFYQPPPGGPFSSTSPLDTALIVAFGQDLWGGGVAQPELRMAVTGTFGTRKCIIQWKNFRDKLQGGSTLTSATQYDTINFQIILYESTNAIEFVFGRWVSSTNPSSARFGACGLKGSSNAANQLLTITKGSAIAWSNLIVNAGNYTTNALNYGNNVVTGRPAPDIGRTYHFNPVVNNDASVNYVKAMGKVAIPYYVPDSITASITNQGVNTLYNLPVTMTVSGTNTFSTGTIINSLAPSATAIVSFPPYNPANVGSSLITVSVPNDDNPSNNSAVYSLSVSNRTMSYMDSTKSVGQSYSGSSTIFASRYRVNGTGLITSVKFFLLSNSAADGVSVYGVVIDSLGAIVATTAPYVLQTSDLGNYITFNFPNPPLMSNTYFFAGMACGPIVTTTYFLGTIQNEVSPRQETCVTFGLSGGVPSYPAYGRFMTECTIDPIPAIDVGVSISAPGANATIPTGVNIPLRAVVKNFGTQIRSAGIQVWYSVNGGIAKGPVSTTSAIAQGDTTSVLFTSTNSLNVSTAGSYSVKFYTSYPGDLMNGNDTLTVTYNSVAGITSYPYRLAANILTTWTPVNNTLGLWKQGSAMLPNGIISSTVLYMDNFNISANNAQIVSPIFNFTGLANPVLHFNVAHAPRNISARFDSLEVLVSTDGGYSYTSVYTKVSQLTSPPLGTVAASAVQYNPATATDWRHEAVNLAAFANNPYIIIAIKGSSGLGNQVYISNIIISNPSSVSVQPVYSAMSYTLGNFSVYFPSAIGAFGGEVMICRYNTAPYTSASPVFATNTSATAPNNAVFTPSNVSVDRYWTATYSGFGTGYPASTIPYSILIDYAGMAGISSPDNLYVMKRSENNGSWNAVTTYRGGTLLSTTNLYGFSDFVLGSQPGYNVLPLKWLGFSARLDGNNALLEWSTASEQNNDFFEVERAQNGYDFSSIGNVSGTKNTNKVNNYKFVDPKVIDLSNIVYYRVKQYDMDGNFSYSKIVSLDFSQKELLSVYPNPFNDKIELQYNFVPSASPIITFTDVEGREIVVQVKKYDSKIVIDELQSLPSGMYLLKVNYEGSLKVYKILKAK